MGKGGAKGAEGGKRVAAAPARGKRPTGVGKAAATKRPGTRKG